jgi:hypothetical protein
VAAWREAAASTGSGRRLCTQGEGRQHLYRRRTRALPKDGGSTAVVRRAGRDTAAAIGPTRCVRPVGAALEPARGAREGETSRGPSGRAVPREGARRGRLGRYGACGCAGALERGRGRIRLNVSDWQRLTEFFSKFLNRSAQSCE